MALRLALTDFSRIPKCRRILAILPQFLESRVYILLNAPKNKASKISKTDGDFRPLGLGTPHSAVFGSQVTVSPATLQPPQLVSRMRLRRFSPDSWEPLKVCPCFPLLGDVFHLPLVLLREAIRGTLGKAVAVTLLACSRPGFSQMKI